MGVGAKQKSFRGGSMDIFWNCTLPLMVMQNQILKKPRKGKKVRA